MSNFKSFSLNNFLISLNYKSEIIKAYLKNNKDFKINFYIEKNPTGTAGSLKYIKSKLTKDFIVSNCDIMANINYHHLFEYHKKNSFDMTLVVSKKIFKIPYGVCKFNEKSQLKNLIEKPSYQHYVNIGLYVFKKNTLEHLPKKNYIDMNNFIEILLKKNKNIGIYPISDKDWIDTGQWREYKVASSKFNELFNK